MTTFVHLSSLIVDVNAIEGLGVEQRRRKSDTSFKPYDYLVFVTTKHQRYRLFAEIFETREQALARRDTLFEEMKGRRRLV